MENWFEEARKTALLSGCKQARCGCVIVKDGKVIGRGFNSPPKGLESQRRCNTDKEFYNKKVTDKTCCVHAEQRAMFNALRNFPHDIEGSELFFTWIDNFGKLKNAGKPYCTICSKMALDLGIKNFILWHEEGIKIYDTEEYNNISFDYKN